MYNKEDIDKLIEDIKVKESYCPLPNDTCDREVMDCGSCALEFLQKELRCMQ